MWQGLITAFWRLKEGPPILKRSNTAPSGSIKPRMAAGVQSALSISLACGADSVSVLMSGSVSLVSTSTI